MEKEEIEHRLCKFDKPRSMGKVVRVCVSFLEFLNSVRKTLVELVSRHFFCKMFDLTLHAMILFSVIYVG